jgi:hypothetical protein
LGFYRHPRTTQEIREFGYAEMLQKEHPEFRLRRARSRKGMPTLYDDAVRSTYCKHPCWKQNRKTQWKVPVEPKPKREKVKYRYETPMCARPQRYWGRQLVLSAWDKERITRNGQWFPFRVRLAYRKPKQVAA